MSGYVDLYEGVVGRLHEPLLEAMTAVDMLTGAPWGAGMYPVDEWKESIKHEFEVFSQANVDQLRATCQKLQETWSTLISESTPDLNNAHYSLRHWVGPAAENTRSYIENLKQDYQDVGTSLSVLESDVVAAYEAIEKARDDLAKHAGTLKVVVEKLEEAEEASESSGMNLIAAGFAGALTGLLTVATAGAGAVAGAAALSNMARGAILFGTTAGSMAVEGMKDQSVAGSDPWEIMDDFFAGIGDLKEGMNRAVDDLVDEINSLQMPKLQRPPDVSPGESFDPDNFETGKLPEETEENVRESDKDIPPSGSDSGAGGAGGKVQ